MMSTYLYANIDETKSLMLFNFEKEINEKLWRTITDTVMGGGLKANSPSTNLEEPSSKEMFSWRTMGVLPLHAHIQMI